MDYGWFETELYIRRLENRIKNIYTEAYHDIDNKMQDFIGRYKVKEEKYLKQLKDGLITKEDFNAWKRGQVFQGKQWQAKKREIENVLHNANTTASRMANGEASKVFMSNANYMAYSMEHGAGVNFGFNLYDSATVANLIESRPNLLPYYMPKKGADMMWNSEKITHQVTQGIIQGENLNKIANRIAKVTGSQNKNSMLTHARTVMTGAQNAGRQIRIEEARDKGIKVKKEWMATLDEHTRWQHAELDGQKVDPDEYFEVDDFKIKYPGDPFADACMVYNCRCTLVEDVDDYPDEYERYDNIDGKPIQNMTYKEWEKAKNGSTALEFNQVSIGRAQSVEEINDLLNIDGLFRDGFKADLTGCDLSSAKSIAASYEQVFNRYPQLKGKFAPPNAQPVGMDKSTYAWCYIRNSGRVEVNPLRFSNWNTVVASYERDVMTGFHPYGTTAESIVTHEIGHGVDGLLAREGVLGGYTSSGEYRYASSSLKSTIMRRLGYKGKDNVSHAIRHGLSRYATKDPQEWFAEAFAEYITSANPRDIASEFGKELEKLIGRLK